MIVISHLHGDHYYGLIGLLSTLHLFGRQKELILVGPPGLADIISLQLKYSNTTLNFRIDFREWKEDEEKVMIDHPKFEVSTLPLDHRVPCSGYLFKEKPKKRRIKKNTIDEKLSVVQIMALKNGEDLVDLEGKVLYENKLVTDAPLPSFSYAYCSDTRFKPALANLIQDTDMLYHESTFAMEMAERARQTYHSTAAEAAEMAKISNAKKLILGHFSTRYQDLTPLLDEAQAVFPNSHLAIEGTQFVVNG